MQDAAFRVTYNDGAFPGNSVRSGSKNRDASGNPSSAKQGANSGSG